MFKRAGLTLGRCTQDCLRGHCIRSRHLTKIQEPLTADAKTKQGYHMVLAYLRNKGIYQNQNSERDGQPAPKRLEDGSVRVIHVQGNESASLANPMERRFLHDLEFQQTQRFGENRWLKEEKKTNQEDLGSLTKEITMAAGGGKCSKKGAGKKADPCKKKDAAKKKAEEEKLKKKCAADKLKKQCAALAQKEKCAKKAAAKKKADPCKKKDKKKGGLAKKCKAMAEKDKCKKLAKEKAKKEMQKKCKAMAQKEKCKKMAAKKKCKKPAAKPKCKKPAPKDKCKKK